MCKCRFFLTLDGVKEPGWADDLAQRTSRALLQLLFVHVIQQEVASATAAAEQLLTAHSVLTYTPSEAANPLSLPLPLSLSLTLSPPPLTLSAPTDPHCHCHCPP